MNKKIIFVIAACILIVCGEAQTTVIMQSNSQVNATYCAMLKDGKIMLFAEGKQVNNEVKLANGTIVKTDGTLEKTDNTKVSLKNGDCIDQDGNILPVDKKRSEKDKKTEENKDREMDDK